MNTTYEEYTGETTETELAMEGNAMRGENIVTMPYKGPQVRLRIGTKWIVSRYKNELYWARLHKGPMREYIREKYGWTQEIVETIYWLSDATAQN